MNNVENQKLDSILNKLDDEELKNKIIYQALINGGKVLQETSKKYFRERMGEAATHVSKWTSKPFVEGIVIKGDKAYCEARVSIMKDHRMKWFEKGTKDRYTQNKGHSDSKRKKKNTNTGKSNYRGKVTAKWFFKDARTNSINEVNQVIITTIDNGIKKILS